VAEDIDLLALTKSRDELLAYLEYVAVGRICAIREASFLVASGLEITAVVDLIQHARELHGLIEDCIFAENVSTTAQTLDLHRQIGEGIELASTLVVGNLSGPDALPK